MRNKTKFAGIGFSFLLLFACPLRTWAGGISPDLESKFKVLLRQMNDDSWSVREKAADEVAKLPPEVLPLIEAALKANPSPDVQITLSGMIDDFRLRGAVSAKTKATEARHAKYRDFVLAEYARAGSHNATWDTLAREGIVLHTAAAASQAVGKKSIERVITALQKSVDAGCDDPLVLLYLTIDRNLQANATLDQFDEVDALAKRMLAGSYSPRFKILALLTRARARAVRFRVIDPGPYHDQYLADLDAAASLIPKLKGTPTSEENSNLALGFELFSLYRPLGDFDKYRDDLADKIAQASSDDFYPQFFQARVNANLAATPEVSNHAKYSGLAYQGASKLVAEHPRSLEALSLKLHCVNPVKRAEEFDATYKAALAIDSFDATCRGAMLQALALRGDSSAVMAYGDECLNSKAWGARTPLLAVRACEIMAASTGSRATEKEYLARPDIFDRMSRAYVGVLSAYPGDNRLRSQFAAVAVQDEKWDVACEQFDLLGDDIDPKPFGSDELASYARRKAKRMKDSPAKTE